MNNQEYSYIIRYFIEKYFNNDINEAAKITGYNTSQIRNWLEGKTNPKQKTIEYFIHCATTPEFEIIKEFFSFNPSKPIQTQIKKLLGTHQQVTGIYAFYDILGNLLYIGKANKNLLNEIQIALKRDIPIERLPHLKNIKNIDRPKKRSEVVRYISAYYVKKNEFIDYAKHIESLILRISKQTFNIIKGSLFNYSQPKEN